MNVMFDFLYRRARAGVVERFYQHLELCTVPRPVQSFPIRERIRFWILEQDF